MLRSLEIQNFKGIKQGKIDDLAQVNILVGRNNSGKSTILDALVLLRSAIVGTDFLDRIGIEQIIRRRVDQRGAIPSYDELWFRMNTKEPFRLTGEMDTGPVIRELWHARGESNMPLGNVDLSRSAAGPSLESWRSTGNSDHARAYSQVDVWTAIKTKTDERLATFLALIHILEPSLIHQPFNEAFWYELARDRKEKKVIDLLNDIYQTNLETLSFGLFPPPQRRLVAALPKQSVAVDWFGDGFRYAVNILSLGVVLQGTALLIEELETHQHPESLRMLTQTLFKLAKQQNLQLFLTTHSMELITYALDAAKENDVKTKLHHLSLDREGDLKSIPFDQPNAELMLDIGHDPRLHYKYVSAD
ncbi:MAG: hypothetical protein CMJ62_15985 [Planctomycetaceae bacterium]|nr:hypothetical protein [Planctomycetaceae bacterium]